MERTPVSLEQVVRGDIPDLNTIFQRWISTQRRYGHLPVTMAIATAEVIHEAFRLGQVSR